MSFVTLRLRSNTGLGLEVEWNTISRPTAFQAWIFVDTADSSEAQFSKVGSKLAT
jgi:hypothetical protein